jgi:hypothetical protein
MKRPRLQLMAALLGALCGISCSSTQSDHDCRSTKGIESYQFVMLPNENMVGRQQTPCPYLRFECTVETYTLRCADRDDYLVGGVYYTKTFGGADPAVTIHIIDRRFVVFPETVRGSEDRRGRITQMLAVVRAYDLYSGRTVYQGNPFPYDHDVPLVYDLRSIRSAKK